MTICIVSSELMILVCNQSNLDSRPPWVKVSSENIVIVVFKVKVTAKFQHFSACLSGRYRLNRSAFCNRNWYGDTSA